MIKSFVVLILIMLARTLHAQLFASINIGKQPPMWIPVGFTEARYYYLPSVETYYELQTLMFNYSYSGIWVHRTNPLTTSRN